MRRRRSSLFCGQEQQDSHESLRCILLYVQEATRAINQQRALHHDITTQHSSADSVSRPSSMTNDADMPAGSSETGCLSASLDSPPQNPRPDNAGLVSATAPTNTVTAVSPMSPLQDCLIGASPPASAQDSKLHLPNTSQSTSRITPPARGAKRTSSGTKITSYFTAPPKTASDLAVTTAKVADFVEMLYEGKCERSTRCLVCESRTRCTETFQDIEVVAQKAAAAVPASDSHSSISDDDDDSGEIYYLCQCESNIYIAPIIEGRI